MKKLPVILIVTLLGCQPKTESSNPEIESEVNSSGLLGYLKEESTIVFAIEFNCLILPPAELFPDSVIDNSLPDIITVTPANWVSKTNGMYSYTANNDLCEIYPLFKFQLSADSKGWVHGSQVFLSSNQISAFTFQGIPYQLHVATSTGIGTSTDEGTTGCSEYQLLYLQDNTNKLIHLISVNAALQNLAILGNTNQQWFSYIADEGMSVAIKSVNILNNQIVIDHTIEYQEGSREAKMYLTKEGKNFEITKIEASSVLE